VARSDRPFIKLLRKKKTWRYILVDLSGSMDWGKGKNKLRTLYTWLP
jgi:hypothetical protein